MTQRLFADSREEARQMAEEYIAKYDKVGNDLHIEVNTHGDECIEVLQVTDNDYNVWLQYTYPIDPSFYESPFLEVPVFNEKNEFLEILNRHNGEIVYDDSDYDPDCDDYDTFHEDMKFTAEFEGVRYEGYGGTFKGVTSWSYCEASRGDLKIELQN